MWTLAIAGAAVVFEFYRLAAVKPSGDVPGMIVQAVMVLFFCMLGLTVTIVFQLTAATKRILRAIELTAKA
jgi:hypothetical protein